MLPRWAITPDGHWSVGLGINHNHCIRCGRMIFIGGQVDLDMDANQLNPGDLHAQAARSMVHVATLLAEAGAEMADLVKLTVFYVSDGSVDETDLLDRLADEMGDVQGPGPAITLVPLEALVFPGMENRDRRSRHARPERPAPSAHGRLGSGRAETAAALRPGPALRRDGVHQRHHGSRW